jgi:tRNA pseudouridine38-40 synthase
MGERNIRLIAAYDGTDFSGWQRQDPQSGRGPSTGQGRRTVQGCIEDALGKIHKHPVPISGSGRTDAGVHAAGQVANFFTDIGGMDAARFVPALNSLLPRDIRVLDAQETYPGFHARFDAKTRTYRYHLIAGRPALPHELRYNLHLRRRADLVLLNDYARFLRGEMDCGLFAGPQDPGKSPRRYISQAYFFIQGDTLVFEIRANAFLWKMVRSIAGTLLHYEERRLPPADFADMVRSADRSRAGPTLPPQGLFLWKIDYYQEP